jgi:hypothetical protein
MGEYNTNNLSYGVFGIKYTWACYPIGGSGIVHTDFFRNAVCFSYLFYITTNDTLSYIWMPFQERMIYL